LLRQLFLSDIVIVKNANGILRRPFEQQLQLHLSEVQSTFAEAQSVFYLLSMHKEIALLD
jgi:hypothetical protein